MSEFHLLINEKFSEFLYRDLTMDNKNLDGHKPPDERAKEHLPTSEDLVSASFHGLHESYWKMF